MARAGIAVSKASGAAAAGVVAFRAANANRDARIYEIGIFASTAVSGTVGIGRPATAGTSSASTGPVAANMGYDNVAGAGTAVVDTAWSVAPTAPAIPWKRAVLPATIGAGVIWTFPVPLVVPANGGTIIVWQFSAAAVTYEISFDFDE
jgi:hypothetical protein